LITVNLLVALYIYSQLCCAIKIYERAMTHELPLLSRGFRPFFFLGATYAVISIFIWMFNYSNLYDAEIGIWKNPFLWHGHEMIFGFAMAIIAGFLLTAVANWTGGAPIRNTHLVILCFLWVAGRVVMSTSILPAAVSIIIDVLFIPVLTASLSVPLINSRNKRNFVFLFMLAMLFLCNVALQLLESQKAMYISILVVIAMISLIGGRIIPAFTVAGLRRKGKDVRQTSQPKSDISALLSLSQIYQHFYHC
jgi:uncharacterized protein involved in response to NO